MSTITAVLTAFPDGTLHLPLPEKWHHQAIKVSAVLEPVSEIPGKAKAGLWKEMPDRFWMATDFDAPLDDFREHME